MDIPQYGPGVTLKPDQALPIAVLNLPAPSKSSDSIRYGPSTGERSVGETVIFASFEREARIRDFDATILPSVSKKESYNDDIKLEHFQSSARHHAGKQRKGVVDEHMECLPMLEHVDASLSIPFFLSLSAPLPASILDAALFIRDSPPELVLEFWDAQLLALDKLILEADETEASLTSLIPPEIAQSAGKLKLAALMSLAIQCQLGGSIWLQQFLFVFPLVGRLAQPRCFPVKPKEVIKRPEPISKLSNMNASRFKDRACKSGFKNATSLWTEALGQCEKRLADPALCVMRL